MSSRGAGLPPGGDRQRLAVRSTRMARIMVLTAGSTGDVEPFAALAARLATRAHEVTLAATRRSSA